MNKKWRNISLGAAGFLLIMNPVTATILGFNSNADEKYYSTDNNLYDKQLQESANMFNKAKETSTDEDIKKAIEGIVGLPFSNEYKPEEKANMTKELFAFIDKMEDPKVKIKYATYLLDTTIKRGNETLIYRDYELANLLVKSLPEGKLKNDYTTKVAELENKVTNDMVDDIYNGGGTDYGTTPPFDFTEWSPEDFEDYDNKDTGNYLPGYPPEVKPAPVPPPSASEPVYEEDMEYKTIGGKCYKITTKTAKGMKPIVTKELAKGYDTAFCTVVFVDKHKNHNDEHKNPNGNKKEPDSIEKPYDFSKVKPAPPGTGDNLQIGKKENPSRFGHVDIKNPQANKGTPEGKYLTLQFTLDKTEASPHYYETDMKVGSNSTITYQQQRDILFQLAIRSGGKAVEDKDRFLVLLENKIIVVENQGNKIPVSSFEFILKDFKAGVKAMDTKVGK